ncbi:MAG: hypothetical protein HQL44_06295 [Alphaproteobacteria bacterium]|nr:hypothetical protein [Alphaproteobacteria bacterium]
MMPGIVRLAVPDDAQEATDLLRKLGLTMPGCAKTHWSRMWINNPALAGAGPHPPLGWVLEDDSGRMQGFFANIPMAYCFGGNDVTVGCASQWGVTKEWRSHVPQLAECYFTQNHSDLLLVTTAIKPTGRIFERFGGIKVPQDDLDRTAFWIGDAKGFLASVLRKQGRNPWPAAFLAPTLTFAAWLKRRLRSDLPSDDFEPEGAAPEIDALWREKLQEAPRLLALRTATALRWHYPKERGAQFFGLWRKGLLRGYGVLLADHAPAIGLKRWRLADLLVLEDDPLVIRALLAEAFRRAQQLGAHVLEISGLPKNLRAQLNLGGAFERPLPTWPAYYKTLNTKFDLTQEGSWYLTGYDGDATLV